LQFPLDFSALILAGSIPLPPRLTTCLQRPPNNSSNICDQSHIWGVEGNIVVFDSSGDQMPTTQLRYPQFASGTHQSTPMPTSLQHSQLNTRNISQIQGVTMKIVVFDGSNAQNSVPMLITNLWRPPLTSGTYHSALMPHHSAPVLSTQLQHQPLTSGAHHSTLATFANRAIFLE